MTRRTLPVLAAATAALSLLAGCSGGQPQRAARAAAPSPVPSPTTASPTPSPAPSPATDPLTGLTTGSRAPLVVVKVDNAGLARRYQRGLGGAAVVYQELVEGGATRFAALYDDGSSGEVGPVRSLRVSDIELLRQYGPVAVAFSGANDGVLQEFRKAVRAGRLQDGSYDAIPDSYRLAEWRSDARNFFTTPAALVKRRPTSARAADVGFRFGPLPVGAGAPAATAIARFSRYSRVQLDYIAADRGWRVMQNGKAMPGVRPANVIVQRVRSYDSKFIDSAGFRTPYTVTVGTGAAAVLRDGRVVRATWRRATASAGTRYVTADGKDVPLRPGRTWVLLVPQDGSVTIG